jgi:hypothetical protein
VTVLALRLGACELQFALLSAPDFGGPGGDVDPITRITAVLDDHMYSLEEIAGECTNPTGSVGACIDRYSAILVSIDTGGADKSIELEKKLKRLEGAFGI